LNQYIKTYNTYRPYSSLAGACPIDFYIKSKLNEGDKNNTEKIT